MSKALTSQTLATEIDGEGSRAASETHHARERAGHLSLRQIVSDTLNTLFEWTTEINFGAGVPAPTHEYFEEDEARMNWAKLYDTARKYIQIPRAEAYERLRIRQPEGPEDILPGVGEAAPPDPGPGGEREFAAPGADAGDGLDEALQAVLAADEGGVAARLGRDLAQPVLEAAAADPDALGNRLGALYPELDAVGLEEVLARVMYVAELVGRDDAEGD